MENCKVWKEICAMNLRSLWQQGPVSPGGKVLELDYRVAMGLECIAPPPVMLFAFVKVLAEG